MKPTLAIFLSLLCVARVHALIEYSLGNDPVSDHDWPAGSVAVANLKTRGGYWEGPPLGGGHTTFEYKGTPKDLQQALDAFSKIRWPELRLIIHTGPNLQSYIYGKEKYKDAPGPDWSFAVWHPNSFYDIGERSSRYTAAHVGRVIEPPTMQVYLTPRIDWKQITVPKNLKVTDERATANGYAPANGSVCRGQIYDMVDSKPVADAEFRLSKHDGKAWTPAFVGKTDADGRFEIKNIAPASYSITVVSPDHASRTVDHIAIAADTLKEYVVMLAPPARVAGVVKDESGKPLAGVKVSTGGTIAVDGSGYTLDKHIEATTDANGRFEITGVPAGTLGFQCSAKGYVAIDSLKLHKAPADGLELRMTATGTIKGRILDATGKPDPKAQVSIYPEAGLKIGSWGGNANVDAKGEFSFDSVPPGRYVVSPDPGRQHTDLPETNAKTIDVKAGKVSEVELTKK